MRRCYKDKRFSATSIDVLDNANSIINEYRAAGYELTLRQLYYQFVARGLVENTERSYKRIGSIVNDGRMAGILDWTAIVDRTRNVRKYQTFESPESALERAARIYNRDKWKDQDEYVEVWVEKEALAQVIEQACVEYEPPTFCCRGYVSQSAMHEAARRIMAHGKPTTIIYLGDHDPSGLDMSRDILDRLTLFTSMPLDCTCPPPESDDFRCDYCMEYAPIDVDVERIALNMDQIRQQRPPPNPAKLTDARAKGYIGKYGYESWELDALDPSYLNGIIRKEVERHMDISQWDMSVERQELERMKIKEAING
jgi:hypothetical protein